MDRKDSYTEVFLKAAGGDTSEKSIKDFRAIWWYSTREKEVGGLRMTDNCLEFVETKSEIKTYEIEIPKELVINAQILIWLDQYIDSPWHITKRRMKVLSEKTAFELYLFAGDIKKLGTARTLAKRIRQDSPSE
jgi:hypothetical protein